MVGRTSRRSDSTSARVIGVLAIARGLMARPRILRSRGLAPAIIDDLFKIIAELRDTRITILLVDQMAAQALGAADRGCSRSRRWRLPISAARRLWNRSRHGS